MKRFTRPLALLLALVLTLSILPGTAAAAGEAITKEEQTYVFDRDKNGETLYLYQSPCMLGYDINNQYGGNGVPIQAFVFTMYNKETQTHFPTYCTDIHVTAVQGSDYRRLNLEDSTFSSNVAGLIRAILINGFYIIPKAGESDADHAERVNKKVADLGAAAGVEDLTVGEAIAATQAAIWRTAHGPVLSFPKFCRYVFNPNATKYGSLCSYNELRYKNNDLINSTIETVYNYLISLDPVAPSDASKVVSPASFTELHDPTFTRNEDDTYKVTVHTKVDVQMQSGDNLKLTAIMGEVSTSADLSSGSHSYTLTIDHVPAAEIDQDVYLTISGYQTASGYFLFDAPGNRVTSQTMVGYESSQVPVFAKVLAAESRSLNIHKTTNDNRPLSGIVFDIYKEMELDEFLSSSVPLPENPSAPPFDKDNPATYSMITDGYGNASLNFTQMGLSDGVYLVVERENPAIVKPINPFYLIVPMTNKEGTGFDYQVDIYPKNQVKGDVKIEKDVISIGNDRASVDAATPHTWIIGTSIPDDIASGKSYEIFDTLDNRLDYIGIAKVQLETRDAAGNLTGTTDLADTDYTVQVTDEDSLAEGNPSDSFTLALTRSGISKAAGYDMLRVYFNAQINANANLAEEIPNQASLKYVNSVNYTFYKESDEPVVYTGGASIKKVDADNHSTVLPGAVFDLYRAANDIESGTEAATSLPGVNGKVIKVATGLTTDGSGMIVLSGYAYGTYYLAETQAPAGYNKLGNPVELTINAYSHLTENTVEIENKSGTVLPETGGMGTAPFLLTGSLLAAISILLLLEKKRRAF